MGKPSCSVLEVNKETGEHYGRLAAYLKKSGTPIPINDVWIAALAVQYNLPVLTRDQDFKKIPQITVFGLKVTNIPNLVTLK